VGISSEKEEADGATEGVGGGGREDELGGRSWIMGANQALRLLCTDPALELEGTLAVADESMHPGIPYLVSETSKNDDRREGEVHGAFRLESIAEGIALSTGEAAYIDCQ